MSSPSLSSSRLETLWKDHERRWRRLEDLERRMDECAMRKRRRIANLLDETSTHRRSRLRMFVTHRPDFTLVIEGKLLVGHLDHASAEAVEREAAAEARLQMEEDEVTDELLIRSTDRTLYRGKSENEGDVPVEKIHFTHFFNKMTVSLQTIFQAPEPEMTPKKSSRAKIKRSEERSLTSSAPTEMVWNRGMTADARAWFVKYSPATPPADQELHSVVSTITLWPRPGPDRLYKPSLSLASALFPEHKPITATKRKGSSKKKRRRSGADDMPEEEEEDIPLDNDIFVPPTLTMKEIVSAIFFYIQEKKLQDEMEPSVIVNDKALTNLFQCDRMNFADVQQLLLSKALITDATQEPTVLTYIMTPDTASPAFGEANSEHPEQIPHVLSFDTDVYVEGVFHFRARELLRRIKRREFEYTSSRTRARNMLVAGRANEEVVKTRIEDAVCGRGYMPDHIPVWLALAKAAPPKSEARASAQIDAKTCFLLERLEHHCRAAQAAWDVVDACVGDSNST